MINQSKKDSILLNKSIFCYGFKGKPVKKIENLKFSENVRLSFFKKYKLISAIQSYSWNIILERKSLLMIGPSGCGKTIGYLPCLLSLLEKDKEFRSKELMVGGPFAILFCSSPNQVGRIVELCNKFIKISNLKIKTTTGTWESEKKKLAFSKGCDLLITTIPCFNRLLDVEETMHFDREKIKYMVFDNFSDMYEESDKQVARIFKQFITCESAENSKIQLIITSTKWLEKIRSLLMFSYIKIMLINSFIEAAIMARSYFIAYITDENDKNMKLLEILYKQDWLCNKTIIIFNELSEMKKFKEFIDREDPNISIEFLTIKSNDHLGETKDICRIWQYEPKGKMSVLFMTDEVYKEHFENLDFVHTIIHYSVTLSWTKFDFRYAASKCHFQKYVTRREIPNSLDAPRSIILMNNCDIQKFPQLYKFLIDRRIFRELFDDVKEKVMMVKEEIESSTTHKQRSNDDTIISNNKQFETSKIHKDFIMTESQHFILSEENIPIQKPKEINECDEEINCNEAISVEAIITINQKPLYIEWSQEEDNIKLKMQPTDVIEEYALSISAKNFDITIKYAEDYALKSFDFYARVYPKLAKHELKNNVLLVFLPKIYPSYWSQLTNDNDKMYYIKPSEAEQLREINSDRIIEVAHAPLPKLSKISISKCKPDGYFSSSCESDYE